MVHRRKTEIVQVNLRLREELRQRLAQGSREVGVLVQPRTRAPTRTVLLPRGDHPGRARKLYGRR